IRVLSRSSSRSVTGLASSSTYLSSLQGDALLAEQKRYYRERAAEYDDWWFRRGRYALEPDAAARWFADCAESSRPSRRFGRGAGAHTTALPGGEELRRLADGREFRIVKRYDEPRALERRLAGLGFELEARVTANGSLLFASGS